VRADRYLHIEQWTADGLADKIGVAGIVGVTDQRHAGGQQLGRVVSISTSAPPAVPPGAPAAKPPAAKPLSARPPATRWKRSRW